MDPSQSRGNGQTSPRRDIICLGSLFQGVTLGNWGAGGCRALAVGVVQHLCLSAFLFLFAYLLATVSSALQFPYVSSSVQSRKVPSPLRPACDTRHDIKGFYELMHVI